MPLGLQAKLLRVLQEREVERLGGRGAVALDVRVLATTNRALRAEVAAGRFREDLFYRLNVFPLCSSRRCASVATTSCRWRCSCWRSAARPGQRIPALSADAAHVLLTYSWPGNVRELDNLLQRALILCNGPVIEAEHILVRGDAGRRAAARCRTVPLRRRRAAASPAALASAPNAN